MPDKRPSGTAIVQLTLDRIAFVATDDTAHLLDHRYDGILTDPERWLRDSGATVRAGAIKGDRGSVGLEGLAGSTACQNCAQNEPPPVLLEAILLKPCPFALVE